MCVEKNVLKKHYLISTSEHHRADPRKDKILKFCIVARWKQRPSWAKLRKIVYGNILSLRECAQVCNQHILPYRHSLSFKRCSAPVYLYGGSEKSGAQRLPVMQVYFWWRLVDWEFFDMLKEEKEVLLIPCLLIFLIFHKKMKNVT